MHNGSGDSSGTLTAHVIRDGLDHLGPSGRLAGILGRYLVNDRITTEQLVGVLAGVQHFVFYDLGIEVNELSIEVVFAGLLQLTDVFLVHHHDLTVSRHLLIPGRKRKVAGKLHGQIGCRGVCCTVASDR